MDNKKPSASAKLAALAAGKKAEQQACQYLRHQGLTLLVSNFRCKAGEIDLVMQDGDIIVFIEVKYRKSNLYGGALLSISPHQLKRIIRAAQSYLMRYAPHAQARFDIIALEGNNDIQWLPNAFDAG